MAVENEVGLLGGLAHRWEVDLLAGIGIKFKKMIKTIEWTNEGVRMIDQRKLPTVEEYPIFKTYREVADAIREMVVRGAPAIGVQCAALDA